MRKKISCKVIRTIPLGKSLEELRYTNGSRDKSHNSNSARASNTNTQAWETTTNPQVKNFSKSVIYTDRLAIKSIPTDKGLTTPKLNFYA